MTIANSNLFRLLFFSATLSTTACTGLYAYGTDDTGSSGNAADDNSDGEDDEIGEVSDGDEDEGSSGGATWPNDDEQGSGSSGGGSTGGTSSDGSTSGDCSYDGFPVMIHQASQDNSDPARPLFMYQARDTDGVPFTELQIMSFQAAPYYGPSAPGTYDLSGLNYSDCALCMLVIQGCDNDYNCSKGFFVESGTLQVSQLDAYGGHFRASLVDTTFVEVTIDPTTYVSTPVAGGDRWCVDSLDIDISTVLFN